MKFLKHIWELIVSFFVDVHKFLDEKRVWGFLYLAAALVVPFVVTVDVEILGSIVLVGVFLFLGISLGSSSVITAEIKSLGLLDLITNYSNKGDPSRLFGNVFLAASLAYIFAPLVLTGIVPNVATFWVFAGAGVVLLFGAAIFDKPVATSTAVTAEPLATGTNTGSSV